MPHNGGIDLMRLRGGLGLAGQGLVIASGIRRGEKLKVESAVVSTLANAVNLVYGVQKKEDTQRLEEAKKHLDAMLGASPEPESPPPRGLLRQADAFMQHHSVRISDGMKLGGKYLFRLSGLKANNKGNTWHGNISIGAKVVTLVGKDEDPYVPASQKPAISWIREQSNLLSGGMELAAQYHLFRGAIMQPNGRSGRVENDWLQLGAATLFTGALLAKCFAPFTVEKINRTALFDYAARGLGRHPEALPQVTAYLVELLEKEARIRKLPTEERLTPGQVEQALAQRLEDSHVIHQARHEGRLKETLTLTK